MPSVVLIAIIVSSAALLISFSNRKTTTIHSTEFSVGAINSEGIYVENNKSIYTKDLIECQGLTITPDFEANGTFQVFYYGEDKIFVGFTDALKASDGIYLKDSTFENAKYCRIMITPDVPVDEDGNVDEDFKIRFYNVLSFANDYTITVNKKQNFKKPAVEVVAD